MSEKAHINPEVLAWARKSANISVERAAQCVMRSTEKLREWENGEDQPTIKQAEKLAQLYSRPFAVFFLPRVPNDFQTLQDFRSKNRGEFSTAFIFMMREVQQKQIWASDAFRESGEDEVAFVGRFSRRHSVEVVASDIRKTLGIEHLPTGVKPLKYWIEKAEALRIFVSLSSNFHSRLKLNSEEVKGFAIADKFAPFIFLNSEDWENAQLFTLVHELAHLWINESGISVDTQVAFRDGEQRDINPVEVFCNKVAASALLPRTQLLSATHVSGELSFNKIEALSRKFGVSTLTMLYRLHDLNAITASQLGMWKKLSDKIYEQFLKNREAAQTVEREGGPNYYILQMRRNGRAFSQLVLDFYKGGFLSGSEASTLLKVKLNNLPKFEKHLYR